MSAIKIALENALKESGIKLEEIDAIAATGGPGLIGGVIVGTMFAKSLALGLDKPYIAVNHLEGHLLSPRLSNNLEFPYLMLLVSGGHCQFIAALGLNNYRILGETMDDAVGEAFDKTGKMLGMEYPSGPMIEKLALNGDPHKFQLPKPLYKRSGCAFSFSGLKTAVRELINSFPDSEESNDKSIHGLPLHISSTPHNYGVVNDICASFQYTVGEILKDRLENALKMFSGISDSKNFAIAGGVAANQYLRDKLETTLANYGFTMYAPPMNLCTDNGAMIAWAGVEHFREGHVSAQDFCPRARWRLDEAS
jgi:N6-L-threonylcarbamoyladenine synthase